MKIRITAEAVQQYAFASKDMAAIHLDSDAAAEAGYERPIVHGMFLMGLAQSLYISEHQTAWITSCAMRFHSPLFVDSAATFDFGATYNGDDIRVTVMAESGETIASGRLTVREGTCR